MITGWSIGNVEAVIGKTGLTGAADLRRGLQRMEWKAGACCRTKFWKLAMAKLLPDKIAIVAVRGKERIGHFVVVEGSRVYDPSALDPMHITGFYRKLEERGWRFASYMDVWR